MKGRSTISVHGTNPHRDPYAPVVQPIYQSSTYLNEIGAEKDVWYERYSNTPNQLSVAAKYAKLEGAEAATVLASGMAATALAHLAILRPGDHLVSSDSIYGGTRRLFDEEFGRLGIGVTYVDPHQPRMWRKAVTKTTRAIFFESPTNPLIRVVDPTRVATVAREAGLALIVDSTFASPINYRPLEHGADVVINSGTKYLGGHSDVTAGAVAGTQPFIDEVGNLTRRWGPHLSSQAAWLLDRGLKTLALRVARQNDNAMAVAKWAANQSRIASVSYPGLPSHPDHQIATKILDGYGGLVGVVIKGGSSGAERFLRRLRLITHAPSLGGVETLVSEPRLTSHSMLTAEQRSRQGIPDGFIRISCGIEDADDLIADLDHALND